MRVLNDKFLTESVVAANQTSEAADTGHLVLLGITAQIVANNPSNTTFDTGVMDVKTVTFPAKAGITDGDHYIFYEPDGTSWGIALDTDGTTEPSGSAAWDAVAGANKVVVDCTATTDAASVAAAVEAAVDALTGFTSVITTDDTAADGTMLFTQIVPGVVADSVPLDDTAAGAGSISADNTTPGTATEVDIDNDQVTIPSHGYLTGMLFTELTSTGTLPGGLSTSTNYYVIKVDDDTIQFATSRANALAGTAVNLTNYGTTGAVHTAVVETTLAGTVKLQKNNSADQTGEWIDLADAEVSNGNNSLAYSAAGNLSWLLVDYASCWLRAVVANTSGTVTVDLWVNGKGA